MMLKLNSLKTRIIIICITCTVLIGGFSNMFLYNYLAGIISEKSDDIESMNMMNVQRILTDQINSLLSLGYLCSNDLSVAKVMKYQHLNTLERKQAALRAQEQLKAYLDSRLIKDYINKTIAFNEYGVQVQPVTMIFGAQKDPQNVMDLPLFEALQHYLQAGKREVFGISGSIQNGNDCIALLSPVYDNVTSADHGWIYIELNMKWFSDVFKPFSGGDYFLTFGDKSYYWESEQMRMSDSAPPLYEDGEIVHQDGKVYKIYKASIEIDRELTAFHDHINIYRRVDVTPLTYGGYPVLYTLIVVTITSMIIATLLAVGLSGAITKPLNRLTRRLYKISANDFSFDPDIEKGNDEIAQMGIVVNEMSASITHLLSETDRMYRENQRVEMNLLQSQVKPHFLYNTLDSIRWMATIQKNPGIVSMTRSLSNLLRNIAKGVGDKIPLGEELALLRDYVEIQSIRYVNTFRFVINVDEKLLPYYIVKFTLQPLVENAIFHGIEPTGRCGTVSIGAREDGKYLEITVTDDGIGMSKEKIDKLLMDDNNDNASTLTGIGVSNVHKRLQLQCGPECGLTYESEPDGYTKAIVRIPKEVDAKNVSVSGIIS